MAENRSLTSGAGGLLIKLLNRFNSHFTSGFDSNI